MRHDGLARAFPWLDRTGQLWKMRVALLLFGLTFVSFAAFLRSVDAQASECTDLASLWFVGLGGLFFAWLALAFRCPRCGDRVCGRLMRSRDYSLWFQELMQLRHCPRCHEPV